MTLTVEKGVKSVFLTFDSFLCMPGVNLKSTSLCLYQSDCVFGPISHHKCHFDRDLEMFTLFERDWIHVGGFKLKELTLDPNLFCNVLCCIFVLSAISPYTTGSKRYLTSSVFLGEWVILCSKVADLIMYNNRWIHSSFFFYLCDCFWFSVA